jgi:hypothetical protein
VSWTIDRAGTSSKYRVVAYGDSIYAGYNGSVTNAARSAPTVDGEYLSALWNSGHRERAPRQIGRGGQGRLRQQDRRRAQLHAGRQHARGDLRDVRQRRPAGALSFKSQTGTCNYSGLTTAVANCKTYVAKAMDYINANAYAGVKLKVISNLYYPGYNADNVQSSCKDPAPAPRSTTATSSCLHRTHELLDVRVRAARRASSAPTASPSTWAPTTTATATGRSTPRRCATWPARARPIT